MFNKWILDIQLIHWFLGIKVIIFVYAENRLLRQNNQNHVHVMQLSLSNMSNTLNINNVREQMTLL